MRGFELLVPLAIADQQREAAEARRARGARKRSTEPVLTRLVRRLGGRPKAS